jgi:hypothetical protein
MLRMWFGYFLHIQNFVDFGCHLHCFGLGPAVWLVTQNQLVCPSNNSV